MPNNLTSMTRKELKAILDDAQEQITAIRAELARRKLDEQHEAIDRLSLPDTRTGVQWHEVKGFFQLLLDELKQKNSTKS